MMIRHIQRTHSDKKSFLNKPILHILLIAVVGLLAYSNTFHSPFQWDETRFILDNPVVKDLSYFADTSKAGGLEYYSALKSRYVGYLTFALNWRIDGPDVAGYHVVNLIIHIVNAFLVYFFVILTFRTPFLANGRLREHSHKIAFFTSLLFIAHPLQTEAVTYIFQRLASLVTLFYLSSMVTYLVFRLQSERKTNDAGKYRSAVFYLLSLFFAVLAMKTKENAFTLPIVMVLYELFFFQGAAKKRVLPLIPFLLTLLIIPLTLVALNRPAGEIMSQMKNPASFGYQGISGKVYLLTQSRVVVTYIRLLFLPINQNIDYDYPRYQSFLLPGVFLSLLFLAALVFIGLYLYYRSRLRPDLRPVSFGLFWFFTTLSVESGIIPIPMIICEYRVYLPSVGVFLAITSALFVIAGKFRDKKAQSFMAAFLILVVIFFSAGTYARNWTWGSNVRLWKDVAQKSPRNARGHYNLGNAYKSEGRIDNAIEQYRIALRLEPAKTEAHDNLGIAYAMKGDFAKAVAEFQLALQSNFYSPNIYNNLGTAYVKMGFFDKAIEYYKMAIAIKPDDARYRKHLAEAYELKKASEAKAKK
jgi:tetratricopeptide (TPR) repeat protein